MELGIAGKRALVCAASKGLGKACALSLAREGVNVTIVARHSDTLLTTAAEIQTLTNGLVQTVAADITTEAGRTAILK